MDYIEKQFRQLGGMATSYQLAWHGVPRGYLDVAVYYGQAVRVRKGWYALADFPRDQRDAWAVGGRLACRSALVHYGEQLVPEESLHIEVPANTSRLRRHLVKVPVVVHWARHPLGTEQFVVPLDVARAQAARCRE